MATVLVVDDEFGVADLLEAVLTDEGYDVILASNGKQALERLDGRAVELILLDFMMPIMDGPAFMRAIAADPARRDIPIIVLSSMPHEVIEERMHGYVAFLRKPFRMSEIVATVAKVLRDGKT